jgi:hypothetical protein
MQGLAAYLKHEAKGDFLRQDSRDTLLQWASEVEAASSVPRLHVGESSFEDWYQAHPKACGGDKQLARDAYAAGMGDPLATHARPTMVHVSDWKLGNEFLPFHKDASHVNPDYRDGWNDCFTASLALSTVNTESASNVETNREPVEWQARVTGSSWRRIDPTKNETLAQRVAHLRGIKTAGGRPAYEIRALYTQEGRVSCAGASEIDWRQDGSLIYRLNDDRHPSNCDEINVTMAYGKRDYVTRKTRADQIFRLLSTTTPEESVVHAPTMKIGGKYNWRNQPERLIYIGKKGCWHQFKKIGDDREVWCEVLDADLSRIVETVCEHQFCDESEFNGWRASCIKCGYETAGSCQ